MTTMIFTKVKFIDDENFKMNLFGINAVNSIAYLGSIDNIFAIFMLRFVAIFFPFAVGELYIKFHVITTYNILPQRITSE